VNKSELMAWAEQQFRQQLGLELSDILLLSDNDKFIISIDSKMGLNMASLSLDLTKDEHGKMGDFLTAVHEDNKLHPYVN
jgi:hypothetical protein